MTDLATYRAIVRDAPFAVHPAAASLFECAIGASMRTFCDAERAIIWRRMEMHAKAICGIEELPRYDDQVLAILADGGAFSTQIAARIGVPARALRSTMNRLKAQRKVWRDAARSRYNATFWSLSDD